MPWKIPKIWEDSRCFIIGGGTSVPYQFNVPERIIKDVMEWRLPPSAYSPFMKSIHNEHTIGVNNAFMIGPWIDFVFFGDCSWYHIHKKALFEYPGIKVTCCKNFTSRFNNPKGVKYLNKDNKNVGISSNNTKVGWNKNSGAASISLAAHLGVKQIILLGFDMSLNDKGISHWHGSHRKRPNMPPPFSRHLAGFPQIQKDAKSRGIEILNASPNSTITVFKKIKLEDII